MLLTTTFAEAPTIVAFPPKSAPRTRAQISGSISSVCPSSWTSGTIVIVYGMLSMIAERTALIQSTSSAATSVRPPVT